MDAHRADHQRQRPPAGEAQALRHRQTVLRRQGHRQEIRPRPRARRGTGAPKEPVKPEPATDSVPAARKSAISDIEARVEKAFAEANFGYEAIEPTSIYDTGQFRIAESLEQELNDMREARRQARKERAN